MTRAVFVLSVSAMLLLCGCVSEIGVSAGNRNSYSLLNRPDALMPLTSNVLANFSLHRLYQKEPHNILPRLEKIFFSEPREEYLAALADISSKIGQRYKNKPALAVRYHLSALLYSFCYLAVETPSGQEYNPNAVLILRIYNNSLTELISYLKGRELLDKNGFEITAAGGQVITFKSPEFTTDAPVKDIEDLQLCADFESENLINNSRRFGIGAPLIAKMSENQHSSDVKFAEHQMLPLTAVMTFENKGNSSFSRCNAKIMLIDPRRMDKITLAGKKIPLEYDFSTPIACMAEKPLKFNSVFYTLFPAETISQEGLYYFEPVNPDKIPVVLIHGLMSDTKTWMQMLNTLVSDPDIRNNYQFWGMTYSSGIPIFLSAQKMRQALNAERQKLVAAGKSTEKFDRMVLVGHSMGGLISRLATSTSTEEKLSSIFPENDPRRHALSDLDEENRKELLDIISFKPLDYVKRVVFISVPHRGSDLAKTSIGALGARCIQLPASLIRKQKKIINNLIKTGTIKQETPIFTGIDNLAPDNLALKLLNAIEMNEKIPYHSIIGNREGYGIPGGSDGIVPYSSSHIDNVASELVVCSGHSAQRDPLAIQELRRILLLHLKNYPDSKLTKPLELKIPGSFESTGENIEKSNKN